MMFPPLFLVDSDPLASLLNVGAVGGVLGWFLWQTNPRLIRVEEAIIAVSREQTAASDRQTRAMLILAMSLPMAPQAARDSARDQLAEMDRKEKEQGMS